MALALVAEATAAQARPAKHAKSISCDAIDDPALRETAVQAHTSVMDSWLAQGDGWVTAYTLSAEPANPLVPKRLGEAAPIMGLVRTGRVTCTISAPAKERPVTLRVTASAVSFREAAAVWTPALPEGLLAERTIVWRDSRWALDAAVDRDKSILPPDAVLRKPAAADIPR